MSRTEKIAVALLLSFALVLVLMALPNWCEPDDLNCPTGPQNTGRYMFLFYLTPFDLLLAAGIKFSKGALRTSFLYVSFVFGGLMALLFGVAEIATLVHRFS